MASYYYTVDQSSREMRSMNKQQFAYESDGNGNLYRIVMERGEDERINLNLYRFKSGDNAYTLIYSLLMTAAGSTDTSPIFGSASMVFDSAREVLYVVYVLEDLTSTPPDYSIRRAKFEVGDDYCYLADDSQISTVANYDSAPVIALDEEDCEHIVWMESVANRRYRYYENVSSPATSTLIKTAAVGTGSSVSIAYNGATNDQLCIYCNDAEAVTGSGVYIFTPSADPFAGTPPTYTAVDIDDAVLSVDAAGANFHLVGYRSTNVANAEINRATLAVSYTTVYAQSNEQSFEIAIRTADYAFRHWDATGIDDKIASYIIGTGIDTIINDGDYNVYGHINSLKLPLPAAGFNAEVLVIGWVHRDLLSPPDAFYFVYAWHSDDTVSAIVITPEVLEGSTRNNRIFVCNLDTNAWSIFTKNFMCADIFKGGNDYGDFYAGSVKDGHIYRRDSSYQDDDAGVKVDIDAFWRSKLFQWDGNARFRKMVLDAMGSGQVRFNWQVDRTGANGSVEIFLEPEEDTRWDENTWGLLDPPTYVGLVDGALDDLAVYYYKYLLSKPNYPGLPRYFTSPSYCSLKMTTGEVANNDAGLEIQIPAYADAYTAGYTTIDILRTHGGGTTFYWHPTNVTGWDGTAVNYTDTTADTSLTEEFTIEVPDELVWGGGGAAAYTFKEWLDKDAVGNQFQFSFEATGRDDALKIISVKLYWQPKTLH